MTISFPTDTETTIDAIRGAIGREVTFYLANKTPCTVCTLDPVTDTSTDSFCPVCSGVGYTVTYSGVVISGHITHSPSDLKQWVAGGTFLDGDCRVQVKLTDENLTTIDSATYVNVDGKDYTVKKKTKRGVPNLNRILVDLIEK